MTDPRVQAVADEIKRKIHALNEQKKVADARDVEQDERERRLDYREQNLRRREKIIFGKIQR